MTESVTVPLPREALQRLRRGAGAAGKSLEQFLADRLMEAIPPLPDNVPGPLRDELDAMEQMDDDTLWGVAESKIYSSISWALMPRADRSLHNKKSSITSASMLVAMKAAVGVLGRTDDRFAADVEAGVDDHGAARLLLEASQQSVVPAVPPCVDGLQPSGIVDVSDRRQLAAEDFQLVQPLCGVGRIRAQTLRRLDVGHQQHVGALVLGPHLEIVRGAFAQHRREQRAGTIRET
jgi:hypothetical protein